MSLGWVGYTLGAVLDHAVTDRIPELRFVICPGMADGDHGFMALPMAATTPGTQALALSFAVVGKLNEIADALEEFRAAEWKRRLNQSTGKIMFDEPIEADTEVGGEDDQAAVDLEAGADTAILACGGDARAAVKALILTNAFLEEELSKVSYGYARGGSARGK